MVWACKWISQQYIHVSLVAKGSTFENTYVVEKSYRTDWLSKELGQNFRAKENFTQNPFSKLNVRHANYQLVNKIFNFKQFVLSCSLQ